jgi:4-hydroxybenzoate polyprenyltransferase
MFLSRKTFGIGDKVMGLSGEGDDVMVPLIVDLDGTLIKSDLMVESAFQLLRRNVLFLFRMLVWTARGKAYLKEQVARHIQLDPPNIPHNRRFLSFLEEEVGRGRPVYLATASNARLAMPIAEHFGLFTRVIASDGRLNLAGMKKLKAIQEAMQEGPFDYAGNARVDVPIWKRARRAIVVNPGLGVERTARRCSDVAAVFEDRPAGLRLYLRAIRVHQWLKNLLIGVPLLTSHSWNNLPAVLSLLAAFVSFSLSASATYLLNDLLDLSVDRRHPRKSQRPLASGDLSLLTGVGLMIGLLASGIALAAVVSAEFLLILLLYVGLTVTYSLYFKTVVLIDVIVLASLYTLRILAGTAAIDVVLSYWLFAFSMFLFLSLALIKRCSELKFLEEAGLNMTSGRDYRITDLSVLSGMGVAAGYVAVLVLALFVNSPHDLVHYSHPERLWLLCPPMAYWVSRLWIKTSRGEMHDDPLLYSVRDWASWVIVAMMTAVALASL